jgi:phosphatidylserine/phosphatidylglycerophosphate/cardiolipin synthase-like enzyme
MGVSSLAIGINAAIAEVALEIARLPDLTSEHLVLVDDALRRFSSQKSTVTLQEVQDTLQDHLPKARLEALFFALAQAGVLKRQKRDRRGHMHDQYEVDEAQLSVVLHDTLVAREVLRQVQQEKQPTDQMTLLATRPESLYLSEEARQSILSVAVALHRLITSARREIIILNPFFERAGFDRLAAALLAAARRGVGVFIITRQLTDETSPNRQVLKGLMKQAKDEGVVDLFRLAQYQQLEAGRLIVASHAKVLLADSEQAYIGSANLTEYGMDRFFEVGVLLQGAQVRTLKSLLQAILVARETEEIHLL